MTGVQQSTNNQVQAIARPRLAWVDIAKASSILLVVLVHTTTKHFAELPAVGPGVVDGWYRIHDVFTPLRMPVFFLASGLLAARALERPWPAVRVRRFVQPLFLYAVWFVLALGVFSLLQVGDFDNPGEPLGGPVAWLKRLVTVDTTLWYLVALAGFFVTARLLRVFPAWLVLAGAAVMSTVAYMNIGGTISMPPKHFVFFLMGAYFPDAVRWLSHRPWPWLVGALAAFAGITALRLADLYFFYGYGPLAGVVGCVLGVLLAVIAARSRALSALGLFLGKNTLPIFVMHVPLLAVLHALATGPARGRWEGSMQTPGIAVVYPVVVASFVVLAALILHRLLTRLGAWWLFATPGGRKEQRHRSRDLPAT